MAASNDWYDLSKAFIELHGPVLAGAATIAGAVSVVWTKALVPVWKWYKSIRAQMEAVENIIPLLKQISENLMPNHGTSMRDAIDRIEQKTDLLELRQRTLMTNDGLAHFEIDQDGQYIWVNKQWCKLTNLTESEALGNGWLNCIYQPERELAFRDWQDSITQKRDARFSWKFAAENEVGFVIRDITVRLMRSSAGDVLGGIGTITEHE